MKSAMVSISSIRVSMVLFISSRHSSHVISSHEVSNGVYIFYKSINGVVHIIEAQLTGHLLLAVHVHGGAVSQVRTECRTKESIPQEHPCRPPEVREPVHILLWC